MTPGFGRIIKMGSLRRLQHRGLRSVIFVLCIGVLTALGGSVAAQDVDAAREEFRLGNEAYQQGRYDEAIGHFLEANDLSPNDLLLLYIGQAYLFAGDIGDAIQYLERYGETSDEAYEVVHPMLVDLRDQQGQVYRQARREIDSAWRLAAGMPPPDRIAIIQDVSQAHLVPVQVRSNPSGAYVFVDDINMGPVGVTPTTVDLFMGPRHIYIQLEHHTQHSEVLNVVPLDGGPIPVIIANLERLGADVDISFSPITTSVTYVSPDGETVSMGTGSYRGSLPAGPGVFLLQQGGGERRIEVELIGSENLQTFSLCMRESDPVCRGQEVEELATLVLRSGLAFASISVDGELVGSGIGDYEHQVTAGTHTVRVTQEGYETVAQNVRVEGGERQTWNAPPSLLPLGGAPVGAIVVGSIGLTLGIVGTVFGIMASGSADDFNNCQGDRECTGQEATDFRDSAQTSALMADIGWGLGGALVITSIVMFVTSGPESATDTRTSARDGDLTNHVPVGVGPWGGDAWGVTLDLDELF